MFVPLPLATSAPLYATKARAVFKLPKKCFICLTLGHFLLMHLLHSSIASAGYCAAAAKAYLGINKGETNSAEREHDKIRKDPKTWLPRLTHAALPPPFSARI
jgi:hypothetical protein